LLSAVWISLRLAAFPGDSDGNHRGCGCWICALFGRSVAGDITECVDYSSHCPRLEIRHQPLCPAVGGRAYDRVPDLHQHAGRAAWEADPKRVHKREDTVACGVNFPWDLCGEKCRGNYREFQPLLDDSQCADYRAGREFSKEFCANDNCCQRRLWAVCGVRSSASRLAV